MHLAVDANGMPIRVIVTEGNRHDCREACALIEGLSAQYLLADRGYDSNHIIEFAENLDIECVIPPRKCHEVQRKYDKHLTKYSIL